MISVSFVFLGYVLSSGLNPDQNPDHLIHYNGDQITAIGTVCSSPSIKNKVQVQIKLTSRKEQERFAKTVGKVLAFLPINSKSAELVNGDKILFRGKLNPTQSSSNPYSFDFKKFYSNKGIYHQAQIENWAYINKNDGLFRKIGNQRKVLLNILATHLPTENEYAVGAALCLGSKETLNDELKNEYASTGAMHVLAISGLHVGIINVFLFTIFSLFKTRNKLWLFVKIVSTIALLWFYALFTGGSPSVLRAALMFSFVTVAIYLKTYITIYNTLSAAAMCMLIYDPNLIFDVGFQLSYTAVLGIVYFQPRIYEWLYFENRALDYIWKISAVGIAAQLATFPIGLYYFHHLPFLFVLTGFFVVPLAYLIISTCMILFAVQAVSTALASWIGKVLYGLIWFNNSLIHFISELGKGLEQYFFIGLLGLFILYLSIFIWDRYFKLGELKSLFIGLAILLLLSASGTIQNIIQKDTGFLCIYQIGNERLIDLGIASERATITSLIPDSKKVKYASENLRKFHGVFDFAKQPELIQSKAQVKLLGDKRIAVLTDDSLPDKEVEVDYLVLSDNYIDIQKALSVFDFEQLIIDGNISNATKNVWIDELVDQNIAFHDVKKDGAFYRVF